MGVIGQKINIGFCGKQQRNPAKNGQVVKPQEPTPLKGELQMFTRGRFSSKHLIATCKYSLEGDLQ